MSENRFEIIPITAYALMGLLRSAIKESSLPADAQFIDCHYDYNRRVFDIVVSSDSFSPVEEGAMILRRPLELRCL